LIPDGNHSSGAVSYRMYGTLVDPAALGLACSYGLLAAFAALPRLRGAAKLGTIAALPVIGLALLASQTRAAVVGLGVGLVVVVTFQLARRETRRSALVGLVLVLLAVPAGIVTTNGAILNRFASHNTLAYAAATRDRSAARTVGDVAEFPFGHGMGATGAGGALRADSGFAVDNTYYSYLYETGIPGLAAFMIVQLAFLLLGLRAAARTSDVGVRTAYIGVVAGQVALLCSAWFTQGAFDYAPLAQEFWLFAGAIARQETLA
jgi:O-antigen ligase